MRVFVNPWCSYGEGWKKWIRIEPFLRQRYGAFDVEKIRSPQSLPWQVKQAAGNGERVFIAAGGDGTVNLMVNTLFDLSLEENAILGAVGLGSSNDFHKPYRKEASIHGIPVRIDWERASLSDVISVWYQNHRGRPLKRYCMINASVGITAEANALYNARIPFIKWIQKSSVEAAIMVSALFTILTYRNMACILRIGNSDPWPFSLTNLGVVKNPHFAGRLCYDTRVRKDDGKMGINLCYSMRKWEVIKTLCSLSRKKFRGLLKTRSWYSKEVEIASSLSFALEMDGEVVQASWARFKILTKALRCCQ
ncbi:MAG: diacylglycerol/lipid kinase family protein [Candidatus Aminicenantales bacterium]